MEHARMIQNVDAKLAAHGHGPLDTFRVIAVEDDKIILEQDEHRAVIPYDHLLEIIELTQPGDLWAKIKKLDLIKSRNPKEENGQEFRG